MLSVTGRVGCCSSKRWIARLLPAVASADSETDCLPCNVTARIEEPALSEVEGPGQVATLRPPASSQIFTSLPTLSSHGAVFPAVKKTRGGSTSVVSTGSCGNVTWSLDVRPNPRGNNDS